MAYTDLIRTTSLQLGLPGFTGHSARAGYVTDAVLNRVSFEEIRETGHWQNDSTLRIYMDAASAIAQSNDEKTRHIQELGQYIAAFPEQYFPQLW